MVSTIYLVDLAENLVVTTGFNFGIYRSRVMTGPRPPRTNIDNNRLRYELPSDLTAWRLSL
jgi:hypothetical protein